MTAEEFLEAYASASGVTPEALLLAGRVVATCHCDYDGCRGWQLTRPEHLLPWRDEQIVLSAQ